MDQPTTFRRLLVPLDGSRLAEAVLPVGARLADECGATVVLQHVIEKDAPTQVHGERHLQSREEAQAYLAEVAQRLASPGRDVECHTHAVRAADVAESIALDAEEHAIDLTILCTHGAGGIRAALWGTVAQQVLQHSTRPILLIRAPLDGSPATLAPQTIMVSLDGTIAAEAASPPRRPLPVACRPLFGWCWWFQRSRRFQSSRCRRRHSYRARRGRSSTFRRSKARSTSSESRPRFARWVLRRRRKCGAARRWRSWRAIPASTKMASWLLLPTAEWASRRFGARASRRGY